MISREIYQSALNAVVDHPRKREFFQGYAYQAIKEIRLSIRGGELHKDITDPSPFKGDRGALEHQLVVGLGCEVLGEMLGLANYGKLTLKQNGLTHDWDKRDERLGTKPDKERLKIINSAKEVLPRLDPKLKLATGPEFLNVLEAGRASRLQKLIFYIDDITDLSYVVLIEDRIDSARQRDIEKNNKETNDWTRELGLAKNVEIEIFEELKSRGFDILNPQDVPIFILKAMKDRMDSRA